MKKSHLGAWGLGTDGIGLRKMAGKIRERIGKGKKGIRKKKSQEKVKIYF